MTLIKRQLQTVIQDRMFCGKAIILIGARQVGKSTLFEQILDDPQLGISNDQILSIYCDDAESRRLLENISLTDLRQQLAGKRLVMVDEAQRIQGVGLTLKLITDHFKEVQLLVTGSSSFMLQGKLNEPLTGRKFEYHLYPLSTKELFDDGGLLRIRQTFES
ncbi:MAG: AAA family ATPase, partial [Muribaculaceae bacterium]|nr:AAA family ATPase [Muribaculaceae bacterium]